MAGRASIVGAAVSHVGNVRTHNEDSHFFDADEGMFVVCDGMGGHAAGEVASALAVSTIRDKWASNEVHNAAARWLQKGSPEAHKQLIDVIRAGVAAAHRAILDEAGRDEAKTGMGTTLVGAVVVGGDCVFAHAGDSRAYLVRDGIAMQLTEDHTLLARLMAAGVEVDTTGEGGRFKSMLTNALGIGPECKVSTFVVPLADGDRFLLCSDGISEYLPEAEIGEVLCKQASPARAAQKLVDLALERGGADNATALVVRVLEAGERPQSASERKRDDDAIAHCALYAKLSPQQRLRAQRIALPRDYPAGEKLPAQTLGDRVAWIVVEGEVELGGEKRGPGALIYPEALAADRVLPDREGLATVSVDLRALALRSDDFREICADDEELGEALLDALNVLIGPAPATAPASSRPGTEPIPPPPPPEHVVIVERDVDPRAATDPNIQLPVPVPPPPVAAPPSFGDGDTAALVTNSLAAYADRDPVQIRRVSPLLVMPAMPAMPEIAMPRVSTIETAPPEHDGESELDRVPTVVGRRPTDMVTLEPGTDRAETEPVHDGPTPQPQGPLTLELEALPEPPPHRPQPPPMRGLLPPLLPSQVPLAAERESMQGISLPGTFEAVAVDSIALAVETLLLAPQLARSEYVSADPIPVAIDAVDLDEDSIPVAIDADPEPEPVAVAIAAHALAIETPPTAGDDDVTSLEEIDADLVGDDNDDLTDPPAPPPAPARVSAAHHRVISSEDGAMASGSIGGDDSPDDSPDDSSDDETPAAAPPPRTGSTRKKRISEGWE